MTAVFTCSRTNRSSLTRLLLPVVFFNTNGANSHSCYNMVLSYFVDWVESIGGEGGGTPAGTTMSQTAAASGRSAGGERWCQPWRTCGSPFKHYFCIQSLTACCSLLDGADYLLGNSERETGDVQQQQHSAAMQPSNPFVFMTCWCTFLAFWTTAIRLQLQLGHVCSCCLAVLHTHCCCLLQPGDHTCCSCAAGNLLLLLLCCSQWRQGRA